MAGSIRLNFKTSNLRITSHEEERFTLTMILEISAERSLPVEHVKLSDSWPLEEMSTLRLCEILSFSTAERSNHVPRVFHLATGAILKYKPVLNDLKLR